MFHKRIAEYYLAIKNEIVGLLMALCIIGYELVIIMGIFLPAIVVLFGMYYCAS